MRVYVWVCERERNRKREKEINRGSLSVKNVIRLMQNEKKKIKKKAIFAYCPCLLSIFANMN